MSRLSPGFEWLPAYEELLEQIAATNVVDADWPILRDMIKYKLEEATKAFLAAGPPKPPGTGRAAFQAEDAYEALSRAFEILDSFQGPPFTIQRLCELVVAPRKHYTTLPKYFRALTRVISVTSDRSTFTEDDTIDFAQPTASTSTSGPPPLTHSDFILAGATNPTRRPAAGRSPLSSPKAVPVVVPLLSPIPWLVVRDEDMDSVASMDDLPSPAGSSKLHPALSPPSSTKRHLKSSADAPGSTTSTPTGGLVDEVDPGSGTLETLPPVALTSAGALASAAATESKLEVTSLAERPTTPQAQQKP
ncbi:hypothetical protein RQP46_004448 [Phenoliferia psychrophenolica]